MSHLLDDEGHVYKQGVFSDEWRQQQGFLGPEKDTDWLNRPNVRRDLLGRPEQARNVWGQPIYSAEGRPLYRPAGSSAPSSGGDAAAALLSLLLSIGLLILLVYLVSAIVALIVEILGALVNGWRSLVKRYPRAMRIVHLLLGMLAVGGGLYLKGFDLPVQVAGAALVPALWGWLWLTRRLPLVFMPINALLVGGGLWLLAQATRPTWGPTWSRLTFDLPLVDNLPFLLALLPMSLWLWRLGAQRWPRVFRPLNLLALGALLGFLLLRVWPDWRPAWERWIAPVPLLPSLTGWLIVFLPLGVWLWRQGQSRWPLPFTVLHLLLLGGLVGLTAYHTQPAWLDALAALDGRPALCCRPDSNRQSCSGHLMDLEPGQPAVDKRPSHPQPAPQRRYLVAGARSDPRLVDRGLAGAMGRSPQAPRPGPDRPGLAVSRLALGPGQPALAALLGGAASLDVGRGLVVDCRAHPRQLV